MQFVTHKCALHTHSYSPHTRPPNLPLSQVSIRTPSFVLNLSPLPLVKEEIVHCKRFYLKRKISSVDSLAEIRQSRRLAAIMFTDIVGYTALTQSDESLALDVLDRHNRLLRSFFPKYHGREVKTLGDSFLVEFDSTLDAAKCAIEIQNFLHDYNLSSKDEWKIKLRIGIHLGDVVHRDDDIFGDAVNIASRIEPLANPEGICVSEQVYDQIQNKLTLPLEPLKNPNLKNVKIPISVYTIVLPWQTGLIIEKPSSKLNTHRIAVLPFSSLSPESQDEYFADGMTDEVISTISKIQGLEVISRTSIMQYKNAPKPIREVSKELEVGTVLEGTVRKMGNKLRVTAQMIDANHDRHLWAESYDRELEDVFAIQSDIATKVAEALQARFPKTPTNTESTDNIEAYTIYLKAMQKFHESSKSSLREAVALFERVTSIDKSNARAYVGLANAWGRMTSSGYEDFTVAARKAEIAAKRALQIAPDSGEAHAALANAYVYIDKYQESISEAQRAIELNPNLSQAHSTLGINQATIGTAADGLAELQRGYELDPLSFSSTFYLAYCYMALGRNSEALKVLQKFKDLSPNNANIYAMLADCYMEMDDYVKAQEMLDDCHRINPEEPGGRLSQALLYAYTGKRKETEGMLSDISESETESVRLWGQFFVQNALGNFDETFKALMRMAELHAWPFLIKSSPEFKELRKDPRFLEFCKKVRLPYVDAGIG